MNIRIFSFLFLVLVPNVFSIKNDFQLFPNLVGFMNQTKNVECYMHSQIFMENLENMTLWAYEMWESSANSALGVIQGNAYQLGDFDECLKVKGPFRTQYCLVELFLEVPRYFEKENEYSIRPGDSVLNKLYYYGDPVKIPRNILNVGLCIPAACSHNDLENSLNEELKNIKYSNEYNISYHVSVAQNRCQNDRSDEEFTFGDIVFCFFLATLVIIVLFASVYDNSTMEYKKKDSLFDKIIMCFSMRQNFADLNKLNDSNNPALRILYGLRTLCICMIIIDHRIANFVSGPVMNKEFVEKASSYAATQIIIFNGDLFVDSFFVLSGLLVTYTLLVIFEKRIISPAIIVAARYIRLTPVYAIVVFFFATLFYKTGSGPLWRIMIENEALDCQNNWWVSLLYLGNYVHVENICIIYSWYLPCDFHFLIVAIPLIILIKKKKALGLSILTAVFIISLLIPACLTFFYKLPALTYFQAQAPRIPISKKDFHFNTTYITSHCRINTYFIGMFTGLIYFKLRNTTVKISAWKSHILTATGISLMAISMSCGLPFYSPNYQYNAFEVAAYASLKRPAWALGTAILLLNASYGSFGIMKSFLIWKPWIPLSKLVYGAYLTHLIFQLRSVASSKSSKFLDPVDLFQFAAQDLTMSFGCALILNLLVEMPCRRLLKIVMEKKVKKFSEEERNDRI